MRKIITVALILFSTLSFSQEYNFKPKWNKGDVKQISVNTVEKEYEDGKLISDTTHYNEARIKVLKDNKEDYILEILLENQALKTAQLFYDKLGEELKDYRDLKLIYSINKKTAESDLLNWKEAQKFMTESFGQISTVIEKKVPDMASIIKFTFLPIEITFESKEGIEGYMQTNIGYILTPFNQNFKLGETITTAESANNPFNQMQEVSATNLLTLESVDEQTKTCIINEKLELDLSQFIEMMKGMMQQMSKSSGVNDSTITEKSKEMDDFDFEFNNFKVITFNYETSWVEKVVNTGTVLSTRPKDGVKTKKEVIATIIVK